MKNITKKKPILLILLIGVAIILQIAFIIIVLGTLVYLKNNISPDDDRIYSTDHCAKDDELCITQSIDLKPVIYLYPEEATEITTNIQYPGEFTELIPEFNNGYSSWNVTAEPDGQLTLPNGETYPYLFWEGVASTPAYDMSTGFVVPGDEVESFLLQKLPELGLVEHEYNEFIEFWVPRMRDNSYNLIHFEGDVYDKHVPLNTEPAADTTIRVFMVTQPLSQPTDIKPQETITPERNGFTVVEWGGTIQKSTTN